MSKGRDFWAAEVSLSAAAERFHTATKIVSPFDDDPLDLTLFVSCYNEAAYIVETLEMIANLAEQAGLRYEIIVIDDTSKDNSREMLATYVQEHPTKNILLRFNRINKGLAQNYMDAAFLGCGKYYRLICGDHAETPESTLAVFRAIGTADIIVPYYTEVEGKSAWRRTISNLFTGLLNGMTGNKLHYYNGLPVHLRRNVMRWHSDSRGFGFQADTLCRLIDLGFDYREIPITAVERRTGKSNALTFRNLLSVTHTLLEIGIRRLSNRVYRAR
ncbi:glycosyltransferase [Bradyrhizobium sp. SZCCHNS2005]|uniref:glycosyltransferase n=1 Tax=Bradyrhizobium sp. SZCCHNS2005 TaxID=3057303 RepID=UPI0028EC4833|nr:glycosyltransferase [Bradyrhizobium sp. SZCCHNS2005]